MILLIYGEDTFRSRQRMRLLIDAFKKKHDPGGMNISRFVGPTVSFDALQAGFSSMSFLAHKRMLVVENFFSGKQSEVQKHIMQYLAERDSDDSVILFWQQGTLPGQTGRLATLKKAKKEEFTALQGAQLSRWIQDTAATKQVRVSREAVSELAARVGSDLWTMSTVLDQLSAWTRGTREVTVSDVYLFTQSVVDDNIFHLTDAIAAKQKERALELFLDQLALGSHPLYLLTMLVKQFRLFLQLAENPTRSAQSLGVHPFVYQKASESVSRFSVHGLRQAYQLLAEMDWEFKHGEKDALTQFTRFVRKVAA